MLTLIIIYYYYFLVSNESNPGPLMPLEGSGMEDSVLLPYLTSSTIQGSSIIVPSFTQIFSSQSSILVSSQSSFSLSSFLVSSLLQSSNPVSSPSLTSSPLQASSTPSDTLITFSSSFLPTGSPGSSQDC